MKGEVLPHREESSYLAHEASRLAERRGTDGDLLGRIGFTIFTLALTGFGVAFFTLLVLSESHWTAAGLVGADGGVVVLGLGAILLIWLCDDFN